MVALILVIKLFFETFKLKLEPCQDLFQSMMYEHSWWIIYKNRNQIVCT